MRWAIRVPIKLLQLRHTCAVWSVACVFHRGTTHLILQTYPTYSGAIGELELATCNGTPAAYHSGPFVA